MSEPVKILICTLTTHERGGWVHPTMLRFVADLPFREGYATRVVPAHNFVPAASARNVICKAYKDSDVDWICMMDNDMGPPENLLDTIKDAPSDADVVVPVFYMWDQSKVMVKLCWGVADGDTRPIKIGDHELFNMTPGFHSISKVGTGVIFIRPRILHKTEYPYFTYVMNEDGGMDGTEDVQFSRRIIEAGGKIYGNADIHVSHYHTVDLESLAKVLPNPLDSKNHSRVSSRQDEAHPAESVTIASPAVTR